MPQMADVDAVLLGTTPVTAMYARDTQVWPVSNVEWPPWDLVPYVGAPFTIKEPLGGTYTAAWSGSDFVIDIPSAGSALFDIASTQCNIEFPTNATLPPPSGYEVPDGARGIIANWAVSVSNLTYFNGAGVLYEFFWQWMDGVYETEEKAGGYIYIRGDSGVFEDDKQLVMVERWFPWSAMGYFPPPPAINPGRWNLDITHTGPLATPAQPVTLTLHTAQCNWRFASGPPSRRKHG